MLNMNCHCLSSHFFTSSQLPPLCYCLLLYRVMPLDVAGSGRKKIVNRRSVNIGAGVRPKSNRARTAGDAELVDRTGAEEEDGMMSEEEEVG